MQLFHVHTLPINANILICQEKNHLEIGKKKRTLVLVVISKYTTSARNH
jgi:hypothetical protein